MDSSINGLNKVNVIIYSTLESILKRLHKRIHLKGYALVYDDQNSLVDAIRMTKTVSSPEEGYPLTQDIFGGGLQVAADLRLSSLPAELEAVPGFKGYFEQIRQSVVSSSKASIGVEDKENSKRNKHAQSTDTRILYANSLNYRNDNGLYHIFYIWEIRNVDDENRQFFYKQPEYSFLRMCLDYFYADFYAIDSDGAVQLQENGQIERKYNEDALQFNRRLTRLFFGKMQRCLEKNCPPAATGSPRQMNSEYYVYNLLEKIDDISSQTYENANPFGSILFMNEKTIKDNKLVRFSVEFNEQGRIKLEDAKRIRKLLELTNPDKDVYLIADHSHIYGLGEVNWNLQENQIMLRLDFRGLSKFNLLLLQASQDLSRKGALVVENERKFFQCELLLEERKLVSVSFKNPRLGEEGYSSEKLTQLLHHEFWGDNITDYSQQKVEVLDQVVRKAREQRHGTMVVITDETTADNELQELNKQSTLIKRAEINPEHIRFLTAIDGAIYFDNDGYCYAIGVILDGKADKEIGDASRGARFNSAHRYLHKLKGMGHKCVIVIISEDGMVDLIPEWEDEGKLLDLAEEIIDLISRKDELGKSWEEKQEKLLKSPLVDSEWLYKVAGAHYFHDNYSDALQLIDKALELSTAAYVPSKYYNFKGECLYWFFDDEDHYQAAAEAYEKAITSATQFEDKLLYLENIGICYFQLSLVYKRENSEKHELRQSLERSIQYFLEGIELSGHMLVNIHASSYNCLGLCYFYLNNLEKNKEKRARLRKNSIESYNHAIALEPENEAFYWNRAISYEVLGQVEEAMEDLIKAESIAHQEQYVKKISTIIDKHSNLFITEEYLDKLGAMQNIPEELVALIANCKVQLHNRLVEIATAVEGKNGQE